MIDQGRAGQGTSLLGLAGEGFSASVWLVAAGRIPVPAVAMSPPPQLLFLRFPAFS